MPRSPLVIITNGTKYVEDTERPPFCDCGMGQACSFTSGHVYVCLSKTGVPMAQHRFWPNEFAAQEVLDLVGEKPVVSLLSRMRRNDAIEALLQALGRPVTEA
jgi:hypothetical protein